MDKSNNQSEELNLELNKVKKQLEDQLGNIYGDVPNDLFHYTSTEGLLGIISSHTFHASNVNFVNDLMEIKYGHNLIKEVLRKINKDDKWPLEAKLLCETSEQNPQYGFGNILSPDLVEVFIICLSSKPNQLSQWRGYGNQGQGYSIGLDTQKIVSHTISGLSCKVIYDPQKQEEYITNIFNYTFKVLNNIKEKFNLENQTEKMKELVAMCANHIYKSLVVPVVSFKDSGFEEEDEWRIVFIKSKQEEQCSQIKFKNSRGLLTPYFEVDYSKKSSLNIPLLPIKEIYCGPALQPELTKRYVEQFLNQNGYGDSVIVKSSGIPLRTKQA